MDITSRFSLSSALSLAPTAPAVLEAVAGLSVATTHGATSEDGESRWILAYRHDMRMLCRCKVDGGGEEDWMGATIEGIGFRSGCRTQLISAWFS
jgi:hypothetical protein